MKEVHKRALNQAQRILQAIGVKYAIELETGDIIGELKVERPAPDKATRLPPRVRYAELDYVTKIVEAKKGDVLTFSVDDENAGEFQRLVSGKCVSRRGKGSAVTALKRNGAGGPATVELLIVK